MSDQHAVTLNVSQVIQSIIAALLVAATGATLSLHGTVAGLSARQELILKDIQDIKKELK